MDIEAHGDRRLALLIHAGVHRLDVDFALRKDFGDIHKHSDPVVCEDRDLCGVGRGTVVLLNALPLCVDQAASLDLREI